MERSAQKTRLQRWAVVDTWEASHPDLEYWEVFLSSALGKEKKKRKKDFSRSSPPIGTVSVVLGYGKYLDQQ